MMNRFWDWTENAIDWIFDRMGVHDIEDTSDFEEEEPISNSPPLIKGEGRDLDKDTPNLFYGRFIKDSAITCEVVACTPDDFRVMILKIDWDRLGTYLDVGQTYPLRVVYESGNGNMTVWEIPPENMKRSTSQVLLAWEKGIGWTWDLDM